MGAALGNCRFRQIFPGKEVFPWHVILVAGPPAAGKLGARDVHLTMFSNRDVQKVPRDVHLSSGCSGWKNRLP